MTARSEGLLYGSAGEEETVERLIAYREAGAGCLYAPGPRDLEVIGRLVAAVGGPLNVLAWPGGPTVRGLAAAGVRRVSVGSWFSVAAASRVVELAGALAEGAGLPASLSSPPDDLLDRAWGG